MTADPGRRRDPARQFAAGFLIGGAVLAAVLVLRTVLRPPGSGPFLDGRGAAALPERPGAMGERPDPLSLIESGRLQSAAARDREGPRRKEGGAGRAVAVPPDMLPAGTPGRKGPAERPGPASSGSSPGAGTPAGGPAPAVGRLEPMDGMEPAAHQLAARKGPGPLSASGTPAKRRTASPGGHKSLGRGLSPLTGAIPGGRTAAKTSKGSSPSPWTSGPVEGARDRKPGASTTSSKKSASASRPRTPQPAQRPQETKPGYGEPPDYLLPVPHMGLVVSSLARTHPDLYERGCKDGTYEFLDLVVSTLRRSSDRWGYACKRGNCHSFSQDAIGWYAGPGRPKDGIYESRHIDIIRANNCGHPNRKPHWLVHDWNPTYRWTSRRGSP